MSCCWVGGLGVFGVHDCYPDYFFDFSVRGCEMLKLLNAKLNGSLRRFICYLSLLERLNAALKMQLT